MKFVCPVCEGERFDEQAFAPLTVRRCLTCGLRASVIPGQRSTNYASLDPDAYQRSIGRVRRAQRDAIVGFVRALGGTGEWLDVGCGFGYVLETARAAGFRVRGIEPDAIAAQAARERVGDVEEGFLNDATPPADVISTLDVLEHLHDLNAFAELVKRKARALWVIKVPSSAGLFFRVAHALRITRAIERLWQSNYVHPHTVYFDEASLTRFLSRHNFEVAAVHYLDEVPIHTAVDRLTLEGTLPRWKAALSLPLVLAINVVERLRAKSDALVVIARVRA